MQELCKECKEAQKMHCEHICRHSKSIIPDKVGTPEEIAKAVHYYLDWVRATKKRTWDGRPHDAEAILKLCLKGYELTDNFPTHYTGD